MTDPPTASPTESPTLPPTASPTESPTRSPTEVPSAHPSAEPTESPTHPPTCDPGSTMSPGVSVSEDEIVFLPDIPFRQNFQESRHTPWPTRRPTPRPTAAPHPKTAAFLEHYWRVGMPTDAPTGTFNFRFTKPPTSAPVIAPTAPPDSPFRNFYTRLTSSPTDEPTGSYSPSIQPTDEPTSIPYSPFHGFYSKKLAGPTLQPSSELHFYGPTDEPTTTPYSSSFRDFHSSLTYGPTSMPTTESSSSSGLSRLGSPSDGTEAFADAPFRVFYSGLKASRADDATIQATTPSVSPKPIPFAGPSAMPVDNPHETQHHESTATQDTTPPFSPQLGPVDLPSAVPPEEDTSSPTWQLDDYIRQDEYRLTLSFEVQAMPEILDPSSLPVVESTLIEYLDDQITEIEGVPVFFMQTHVRTKPPKNSIYGTIRMEIETSILATGDSIDTNKLKETIQQALQNDKDELWNHLRGAINSLSVPSETTTHERFTNTPRREGSSHTVIMVATCVTTLMLIAAALSVCVVMEARRRKGEDSSLAIKPVPSKTSSASAGQELETV